MEVNAKLLMGISFAFLVIKKNKAKRKKRQGMKEFLQKRNFNLLHEVEYNDDGVLFRNFLRMSKSDFYSLLGLVEPKIAKKDTHFRDAIPAKIKLAIALRYLATGDSFMSLMYLFRVSKQFISAMLPKVLQAIIEALKDYVKTPTTELEWKQVANDFERRWNFPHCIGSLDGKHVVIQCPENTVSEYHNYKGTFSIVLLAAVDANYCFRFVSVGCQGRISDGGVFSKTTFYERLENGELNLPQSDILPGRTEPTPYVLVADDAFSLSPYLLKPYKTDLSKGSPKRVFNYRLSRARRIVENAFGLLASVFRVFRKPIELKVLRTVVDVVLACVHLHNFLRSRPYSANLYSPPGCFDNEDPSTGEIIPGSWRDVTSNDGGLINLKSIPRNPTNSAKKIRNEFMNYFMSEEGSIPCQNKYL